MGILTWIILGLVVGWLASVVVKGTGSGILGDIILGIIGALVGGFLAGTIFGIPDAVNGFNLISLLVAFIGAIIVLFIFRLIAGGSRRVV